MRLAKNAKEDSPTTAPWLQTRGCVRNATLWKTARNAPYATRHSTKNSFLLPSGGGHQKRSYRGIGFGAAPHATNATRAAKKKQLTISLQRLLHANSAVARKPAQYATKVWREKTLATVSGRSLETNPRIGQCDV